MESIGKQIGKLRQQVGVTQEKLGQAIGVTTQAVSRWECGGTPDATLLPVIADFFEVSIDELFGREGTRSGEPLAQAIVRDIASQPKGKRFDRAYELCRNVRDGILTEQMGDLAAYDLPQYGEDIGWDHMYATVINNEGAIWMKMMREDKCFFLAPEPKDGFGSVLEASEEYEKLFALLGKSGCMTVLMYLYANSGEQSPKCSARWVSENVGLSEEQTADLLRGLTDAGLLDCQRIRVGRGEELECYSLKSAVGGAVLFTLLSARDCISQPQVFAPQWEQRDLPLMVSDKAGGECSGADREISVKVGKERADQEPKTMREDEK